MAFIAVFEKLAKEKSLLQIAKSSFSPATGHYRQGGGMYIITCKAAWIRQRNTHLTIHYVRG